MTGDDLKAILDARGWTAPTFAEHIERSRRQVDRWLTSDAAVPRVIELIAHDLPTRVITVQLVAHNNEAHADH
jgi:hypothetical protein